MSDGDVSLIRDEDLLRRMWQQTEDFSRKKEIRAHMYRLREERLRNLYSPEPKHEGKGSEFTAAQDHVTSFADQSFQSMKSKEVRDAGSPPKEFTYRGQDLKALSNAGWNVEQENKTTDDGRTHVKSINANIEGSYDVEGGKGQFAAVDHHKEAVTEYHDDNSSLKRNETSSNTAAREHVVQQTDDGTHVTSTTSSSSSSSKIQKMSSTRHESVPYVTNDDYDLRSYDTNRNEDGSSVTRRKVIKTNDYEQNLRNNEYERTSRNDYEQTLRKNDYEQTVRKNDYETGELVSRKVDYPDDNTRVIVETRCLPDGTRVTSTKREFRAPVQSTCAEQSYQTRSENRSYSTQQRSNTRDSSKVTQHVIDNRDSRSTNIVDSQRNVDDYDFKRQIADYSTNDTDDYSNTQYERKVNKRVVDNSKTDDSYDTVHRVTKINKTVTDDDQSNIQRNVTKINKTTVDHSNIDNDYSNVQRYHTTVNRKTTDSSKIGDNYSKLKHQETNVNQRIVDHSKTDDDYKQTTQHVTRTHKIIESTDNDEYAHREINQRRYDTNDDRSERIITPDNPNIEPKNYKDLQPKERQPERSQPESYQPRSSQPRETTPVEAYPRDSRPRDTQPKYSEPKNTESKYIDEKIHNITRDDKVETIKRKISTEERKTTYQTDYSQKKISNDWSPSHTAWASTLRGDTPSTPRPSTRASSPGSKTFRSSTSSLRSSVSPDKTYRKPSSRGSSPNKIDRPSPTRSVSDQHYTTHSTHSITETKSHKYMTPDERRPPTGRHPSSSGHSPERKPQDHRQMPSASPEKKPQNLVQRNSVSPDRKPNYRTTDSRPHTASPIHPVDQRHSPTRPQESPERKFTQHIPSVSGYPSSPNRSSISPEKAPTDRHSKDITTRPNQSPDRKPFDGIPGDQQTSTPSHPIDATKKPGHPSSPTTEKHSRDITPNRQNTSPDRKPGYMMPTASRQPTDARKPPTKPADKQSPNKHESSPSPTRKPQDYTATQRKKYHEDHYKFIDEETKMYTRTDKTQIDDTKRVLKGPESPTPREKSSSPTRKSPSKDADVIRKVPVRRSPSPQQHVKNIERLDQVDTTIKTTDITDCVTTTYRTPKDTKSPSQKTSPKEPSPSKIGSYDKKKPYTETTEIITKNKSPSPTRKSPNKDTDVTKKVPGRRSPSPGITKPGYPRDTDSPSDKTKPREKSPSKFGTYDKKRPHTETEDDKLEPATRAKSPKNTPARSVSPTRKTPQSLPSPTRNAPERSTSPTKKSPRDSVSPVKSPTKSNKYAHTTELLTSERTIEEVNKKMTKEHPRQLVTPSSSPSRKPKRPTDTEPSTGQSSPTTSVSGFVYFSSPQTEETIITDLDDHEFTETHTLDKTTTSSKRPEILEVRRSPSPSKIPCRSPSPERPPKDSLPRKSSLKKPGNYATQTSPVEKPPTSFLISPTEPEEFPGHKTVKKDRPDEPTSKSPLKSKPPLERRETYEDRCRKILGMTEDTSETVTTQTTYLTEPVTNLSSPSISPCRSPAPKDTPFTYPTTKKDTSTKIDVTDFITHEQDNIIKSTGPQKTKPGDKLPKPVRDSSPTKLQDIITVEKTTEESDTTTNSTTKYSRQSPQRKPSHQTRETPERDSPERYQKPKDIEYVPSISPAKLHPGSSPRSSSSPDRKVESKEKTPVKKPIAKASYSETTTTVLSKYDGDKDTEEITVTTKTTDSKPSRLSESPTRKTPGETIKKPTHPSNEIHRRKSEQLKEPEYDQPKESTPTKPINLETTISMVAECGSTEDLVESVEEATKTRVHPTQPSKSPTRKSSKILDSSPTRLSQPLQKITDTPNSKQPPKTSPEKKHGDKPKDSSPTRPGYIKTTTSITSKHDTTTEDLEKPSLTEPHSLKPEYPSDRTRTSPSKKPGNKYPEDSSPTYEKPKKLPGYMKVTESVSSKYDTISSEHDEKSTTLKTERYHPSELMESPTRKASKPKLDVTEQDTDLKPQEPSPHDTQRHPEDIRSKDTSPHRSNIEKTPHYMTLISTHRHTHEIETTIEDEEVQRKFANYTERHPEDKRSKDTSPNRSNTEKTPHYMTPISTHRHTHEIETTIEDEEVQRKFANYTETHPEDKRSKDTSPNRSNTEKTPHYMTPISTHRHTHEIETTIEDEEVQRKFANYTERHPESKRSKDTSPNRPNTEKTPHYMTPISSHQHTHEVETTTEEEHVQRKFANYTERHPEGKRSKDTSPHRPNTENAPHYMTPISTHGHTHEIETTTEDVHVKRTSVDYTVPQRPRSPTHQSITKKTPHYMTPVTSHLHKYDTVHTKDDIETCTSTVIEEKTSTIDDKTQRSDNPRTASPTRAHLKDRISTNQNKPSHKDDSPSRKPITGSRPEKTPGYMRPTSSITSKHETISTEEIDVTEFKDKQYSPRSSVSPSRIRSPDESSVTRPSYLREPEKPRQLRTPSPSKATVEVTEISTDFLMSEREQEILDRVHKSLRKLSPERKEKSPSRERSPGKTTTSLQDIDINTTTRRDESISEQVMRSTKKDTAKTDISRSGKPKEETPKGQNAPSKPSSRNASPTKRPSGIASPAKIDRGLDSATKPRSISPKKPLSPTEQPPSPTVPKASGIKPKEQIPSHLTRKPTPASLAMTKVEKITTDLKRTTGANITAKQNSFTKTTTSKTTSKTIPLTTGTQTEPRTPTPKGIRESGIPKKGIDTKVTRTVSEITIKSKKTSPTSPQRMKSKPEIQVSDLSNSKTTSKPQKSSLKEPQIRIPGKPKSATALNTPSDEDDIIIDVQQSKSSRENSPDRICPTPVNFVDDTETPRYPDEVKEPDEEFRRRTYHTIHETETIVDDIVEICEDDELFVRKSDAEHLNEEDESLLSVTDKVTKFTKGIDTKKPKDTTDLFKDTERRVHSDFVKDPDECLLSVSEKVNKFAKGPRDIKDKSPARRVIDEYDKNTVYTDDYTKLSVHDKAHLFVETAENVKTPKSKPTPQKVERPDLTNVDEALKSDDCLLSVSDKVHKFVKTAEQFLTENHEVDEKEKRIKEQHDKIMKKIVDDVSDDTDDIEETTVETTKAPNRLGSKSQETKLTTTSHSKMKDHSSPSKPTERTPTVKITTLRSSEAVKKAKALFENIASTTPKTKDIIQPKTTTKLTDIGVLKKSPKTDSTTVLHPSVEEVSYNIIDTESEVDVAPMHIKDRPASGTLTRPKHLHPDDKPRASPTRLAVQPPEGRRSKSPMRYTVETTTAIKTSLTKYPSTQRAESPKHHVDSDKPEKVPGYLRPTKTSQSKEEPKIVEEIEVSSRRGSGKFGVELRRTSVERSTVSSERRRSVEHPCIEDIFDLDLLEQMLEKVVGYEQRRRIRAQIRIARKSNTDHVDHTTRTRTIKQTTITQKDRSPERHHTKSPERAPKTKPHKTSSPDRHANIPHKSIPERSQPKEQEHPILNGHAKEPAKVISDKRNRTRSPEKSAPKPALKTKSPIRPSSPDKKTRTLSPSKTTSSKPKVNRFSEYASAYMKKVGLSEADKLKFAESKKKATEEKLRTETQVEEHKVIEEFSTSKHVTERTSSKDIIEVIQTNGSKRSPSPEKRRSPDRKSLSRERLHERTPSPDQKRVIHQTKSEPCKRETIIKTVYEVDKKTPQKQTLEEKPSWVTNRNLKKINSETRTFSSKKIEEKPKYRAASPSKVISKPIDVITSSYGPGPLDAEGKPLFGIKALRNGASNYQVKGTVIRQEYHSRNGGEPEGTVSVTAYSTEPEELEQLLQRQGDQPSRIHGLAAITTTKKFGGDTGTTLKEIHGKEERATIDQFTHSDRKVSDSRVSDTRIEDVTESFTSRQEITGDSKRIETRKEEIVGEIVRDRTDKTDRMQRRVERVEKKGEKLERRERPDDKKTVRQSSVKSLTEKYIKSANESSKAERTTYPKAGLILRTATMKDSVSSDSSAHAGLARTDSEHSLGSVEDTVVTTEQCEGGVRTVTTTTRSHGHATRSHHASEPERTLTEKSFLDSNTKVTGVQDILTRMKNADIVIQEGDTSEDMEARALLNKFLGATVLMAGMQSYVTEKPSGKVVVKQETVRTSSNHGGKVSSSQTRSVQEYDIDQCWDERLLRKLLDESKDYEQRRRLRARIRALMAEQEACASAVTEALAAAGEAPEDTNEAREEEEVTVTSSVRRNSSEKTVSSSTTTTKTSKVIESMTRPAPKPVSPFAKFRQLEKQNSTNSPKM